MDYNKSKKLHDYEADMTKFLRELVHFQAQRSEKDHVMRIKEEMEAWL